MNIIKAKMLIFMYVNDVKSIQIIFETRQMTLKAAGPNWINKMDKKSLSGSNGGEILF